MHCLAASCAPHSRLFSFKRHSPFAAPFAFSYLQYSDDDAKLASWIVEGHYVWYKRHVRNSKDDPKVIKVQVVKILSPYVIKVAFNDGSTNTVSVRYLAKCPQPITVPIHSIDERNSDETPSSESESECESVVESVDEQATQNYDTRSGRQSKPPTRFE